MWELDHKEVLKPRNGCFWTVVLEKTLESPLDCKEIKPISPGKSVLNTYFERTDAEAEAPVLWPPEAKNWLIGKDPDPGKDWWLEEKGMTEDEMVGWYHQLNGLEFEQALGVGDGQGSLACPSPWGSQVIGHDLATWLNWTDSGPFCALLLGLWFVLMVMDREACCFTVLGIAKTQTQLSNWTIKIPFKVLRLRTK